MAKNRLKELRNAAGLTQRELAALAQTTQQTIQRIEAGVQSVRLALAARIAQALQASLLEVFPSEKPLPKGKRVKTEDLEETLQAADIDPGASTELIKIQTRGGHKRIYEISSSEKKRLWHNVQSLSADDGFMVFDSNHLRVALKKDHLLYCHFLFEPMGFSSSPVEEEDLPGIIFQMADGSTLDFDMDPDQRDISDESAEWYDVQLQNLFINVDGGALDAGEPIRILDVDGEEAFIRTDDVAIIEARLCYVEPSLFEAMMDGYSEDEGMSLAEEELSQNDPPAEG